MQTIKIDFDNPGLPQRLDVVENDAQSRFFKAVLYKDGKAYAAPSGATSSIIDWVIEPPPRIRIDIPAPGRPS